MGMLIPQMGMVDTVISRNHKNKGQIKMSPKRKRKSKSYLEPSLIYVN